MTTKIKLSLLVSASFALVATPALATVDPGVITPGASVAVDNGGTTCATTNPSTSNPYDPGYVLADTPGVGFTTTVVCTNQDVNQVYNVNDPFDTESFVGLGDSGVNNILTVAANLGSSSESGTATATYETVTESSQVYDTSVDPALPVGGLTNAISAIPGTAAVTNYSYTASFQTNDQVLYYNTYEVNDGGDGGTTGIGSETTLLMRGIYDYQD